MVNSHGEVVEEGNCPTTDEDSELDKVCSGNLGVRPHLWGQGGASSAVRVQCAHSARAVQLFGRLAVLETHTLRY